MVGCNILPHLADIMSFQKSGNYISIVTLPYAALSTYPLNPLKSIKNIRTSVIFLFSASQVYMDLYAFIQRKQSNKNSYCKKDDAIIYVLKIGGFCTWKTEELIFYMAILHSLKRKRYACKRRTSLVRKWSLILLSRSFARAYSTALLSISLSPIPHLHISRKQSADIIILKNWFILMLIF